MLPDGRHVIVTLRDSVLVAGRHVGLDERNGAVLRGQLSATPPTLADTDLSVFVTTMNWVGALSAPSTAGPTMLRV